MSRLLLIFLFLLCSNNLYADEIRLKSGIFMKGKVIEESADYIIMKTSFGAEVKYARENIVDLVIDGQRRKVSADKSRILNQDRPSFDSKKKTWDEWVKEISYYHLSVEKVVKEVEDEFLNIKVRATRSESGFELKKTMAAFDKKVASRIDLVKSLKPPHEFRHYHGKIINFLNYIDQAQEEFFLARFKSSDENLYNARSSYLEAFEEIQLIFIQNGAPSQVIEEMSLVIESYKNSLQ